MVFDCTFAMDYEIEPIRLWLIAGWQTEFKIIHNGVFFFFFFSFWRLRWACVMCVWYCLSRSANGFMCRIGGVRSIVLKMSNTFIFFMRGSSFEWMEYNMQNVRLLFWCFRAKVQGSNRIQYAFTWNGMCLVGEIMSDETISILCAN